MVLDNVSSDCSVYGERNVMSCDKTVKSTPSRNEAMYVGKLT